MAIPAPDSRAGKRIAGPAGKSRPDVFNIFNNIFHICSNVFSNPLSSIYNSSRLPTRILITLVTGDQKGAPLVTGGCSLSQAVRSPLPTGILNHPVYGCRPVTGDQKESPGLGNPLRWPGMVPLLSRWCRRWLDEIPFKVHFFHFFQVWKTVSEIMPKYVFGLHGHGRIACRPFSKRGHKSCQGSFVFPVIFGATFPRLICPNMGVAKRGRAKTKK